jgi:hypothetical protein
MLRIPQCLDNRLTDGGKVTHRTRSTLRKRYFSPSGTHFWRNSELSNYNKLTLYKQIPRPVWSYGIQLWGCASDSNIQAIQRFQNKVLKRIVQAPWYIRNSDLQITDTLVTKWINCIWSILTHCVRWCTLLTLSWRLIWIECMLGVAR